MSASLRALISSFAANVCGGLAMTFAMAAPVMIGSLGIAVDFVNFSRVKAELQAAADAAAVAGAREMQVAKSDDQQVTGAAVSYAAYKLTGNADATSDDLSEVDLAIAADVNEAASSVRVSITERWTPFFAHFISTGITPVTVSATARFVGSNNICVLGLSGNGRAVYLDQGSRLTGNGCGVYSNSSAKDGFKVDKDATLRSSLNCSFGGVSTSSDAVVSPSVLADCPAVSDPLSNRPPPAVGSCDHDGFVVKAETRTLQPGVYCNGLRIEQDAAVTLSPGTYVIKNGEFRVASDAWVSGEGVSMFITGDKASPIYFAPKSHISLSAPKSGTMAGLLVYEDRATPKSMKHKISSDDARKLEGTIYLPVGDLVIDAKDPVADQSAYTAIIVNRLELELGPNLILNSDYEDTNVPVPEGIRGTSQVVLTE